VGRRPSAAVGIGSQGVTASQPRKLSGPYKFAATNRPAAVFERCVQRYFLVGAGCGAGGIFGEPC